MIMETTNNIDKILRAIEERRTFAMMKRYQYSGFSVEDGLKVIEAVGKARNPRFVIDDENRFTYENFIKWCHGDASMQCLDPETNRPIKGDLFRGIYIAGNTGTGKSWCLEIMREYAAACRFAISFPDYDKDRTTGLTWGCIRAKDICEYYTEHGDVKSFKNRDILAIQDFGSEPVETLYMGNREDVIRQIIEYRGDTSNQLTLITSNLRLSGKKLNERYGDRVESRLHEMCNYFIIQGKDRRKF